MSGYFLKSKWVFLCLACVLLSSCAGKTPGEHLADMPHWMGGEPAGVPPRRGTPEYDAWMAARAQEAARPKADQKGDQSKKTDQPDQANQSKKSRQVVTSRPPPVIVRFGRLARRGGPLPELPFQASERLHFERITVD